MLDSFEQTLTMFYIVRNIYINSANHVLQLDAINVIHMMLIRKLCNTRYINVLYNREWVSRR